MTPFRFVSLLGSLLLLLIPTTLVAQVDDHSEHNARLQYNLSIPEGTEPGDTKYLHGRYHDAYQLLAEAVNVSTDELGPGDTGYRSDLRPQYRTLYSGTKCSCQSGSCRPTQIRFSSRQAAEGESGYEVLLDERWYAVPQSSLNHENDIPVDIWESLMGKLPDGVNGHGCAFPSKNYKSGMNIECVLVPKLHG